MKFRKVKVFRVDDGFEEGMDISIFYDPMIAKLVAYAPSRAGAIRKLNDAIGNYHIEGVQTTLPFGQFVCEHPAFTSGNFDTHFVKKYFTPEKIKADKKDEEQVAAQLA